MLINSFYNFTPQYNTNFRQAPQLKEVLLKIPDTGKVSTMSKAIYKQYLNSKNLPKAVFGKQELDKMFSIEKPRDFAKACFKGRIEKLNIPKKIAPKLVFENIDAEFDFGYERTTNCIIVNTKHDVPSKNDIFALMRHEFQHC